MTRAARHTPRVLAALVVVLAAGCTGGTTPPTPVTTTSTPSTSTSPPTPTQSPSPTPEDEAALRAEEVLRAYLRAQTDCLTDPPTTAPTCFDGVAIGGELIDRKNALTSAQAKETRVSGVIEVDSVDRGTVDLAIDLSVSPPIVPTAVLNVCADVSGFNVMDKDGQSIVPPDRAAVSALEVSVYNYEYPDQTGWRVGLVVPAKDLACGG